MKDDLDQLLKSHLKRKLDPQRGSALETFRDQVIDRKPPVSRHTDRRIGHRHVARWIAAGVAVAACLLVAYVLSSKPQEHKTDIARHEQSSGRSPQVATDVTPVTYTRVVTHTDRGMVMLDDKQVGRRVSRNELHHYRWTDESGAVYEYFAPSEQEFLLQVHQQ